MKRQLILLSALMSPKTKLDHRKRSQYEFYQFVIILKTKRKLDTPVEVYPLTNGKYYISDGVHRAKAAELAGLNAVDTIVYTDSKPIGHYVALKDVSV